MIIASLNLSKYLLKHHRLCIELRTCTMLIAHIHLLLPSNHFSDPILSKNAGVPQDTHAEAQPVSSYLERGIIYRAVRFCDWLTCLLLQKQ